LFRNRKLLYRLATSDKLYIYIYNTYIMYYTRCICITRILYIYIYIHTHIICFALPPEVNTLFGFAELNENNNTTYYIELPRFHKHIHIHSHTVYYYIVLTKPLWNGHYCFSATKQTHTHTQTPSVNK